VNAAIEPLHVLCDICMFGAEQHISKRHSPKCLARSACRYLQPTNVRVAGNLIAARKSMIWKMDENGILFKFILNK
jgi:hypothetical protein